MIGFTLLSDEGSRVIRELNMLDRDVLEHQAFYGNTSEVSSTGDPYVGVPYPGTFVLDEQGRVVDKRFPDSYRERETGAGLLEGAFGIESSVHADEANARAEGVAVRAYLDSGTYRLSQRLRLTVELTIDPGLHVYGEPIPEGYVPLTVEVAPVERLVVGALEAPAPHPFRVEGLDEQFFVYEGTVKVSRTLTFWERTGDHTLDLTVRYQACSADACLMPGAIRLQLPARPQTHVDSDR